MRRYRIVSDGEEFKLQLEKWFIVWYWSTIQEYNIYNDGCGGGYEDKIFSSQEDTELYIKKRFATWSVVSEKCIN